MAYIKFRSLLIEEKLSTKERNELPDSEFGIPSQRRFPLHNREHVILAVKFFSHVDAEHEEELARNIIRKMKKYGIHEDTVGKNNKLYKYLHKTGE